MSTTESHPAPYAQITRDLLRDCVLDAVGDLLSDRPWAQVTMSDVAARAGVSRQTLYNTFGSRPDLAQAYVTREADRFLAAVDVGVRRHADEPRLALAAALEIFLVAAGAHPLVRAITSPHGGEELLPLVTTRGAPVIDRVKDHLTDLLVETWPRLGHRDATAVSDALTRLAISYAALPSGDPGETAQTVARLLAPSVDELLG